jgi:hypothetical protein
MAEPHYFSLEEANAIIEQIRPIFTQILEIRKEILDRRPEVWPALARMAGNGGNKAASEVERDFMRLDALLRQVLKTGVVVKDINTGLVDFLSLREGEEIYLCWQYGEDKIHFWHGLDAGFAGRQPI